VDEVDEAEVEGLDLEIEETEPEALDSDLEAV